MIILDAPYVSRFLEDTIVKNKIPVLINHPDLQLTRQDEMVVLDEQEFFKRFSDNRLYSNSENSLGVISKNLSNTPIQAFIQTCKDKVLFRRMTNSLYPELDFMEVPLVELETINPQSLSFPLIFKPSVGFFSLGVYKMDSPDEWNSVVTDILSQQGKDQSLYPREVYNQATFIIESFIEGTEFAVDAYIDEQGQAIILNVLHHLFSSSKDTSDRVYYTGKQVIAKWEVAFSVELEKMAQSLCWRNVPLHVEFRVTPHGRVLPIEVNPMRFAGWCTTDLAFHAYGVNVYEAYLLGKKPDWPAILNEMNDDFYFITVADIPASIDRSRISHVAYEEFVQLCDQVLEMRAINYRAYPVFAFVFARTSQFETMTRLLGADLEQFLTLR